MTRFARGNSSKANNHRVPEDATPWDKLKCGSEKFDTVKQNKSIVKKHKNNSKNCKTYTIKWNTKLMSNEPPPELVTFKTDQKQLKRKKLKNNSKVIDPTELDSNTNESHSKDEFKPNYKREKNQKQLKRKKVKNDSHKVTDHTEFDSNIIESDSDHELKPNHKRKKNQNQSKRKKLKNDSARVTDHIELDSGIIESDSDHELKPNYKRRKPLVGDPSIYVNGTETRIARFEGFPVKKEDADRLKELKKKLIRSKVPRQEMIATLKMERRRAEKALARFRKKVCFHCRHSGHVLSECPELNNLNVDNSLVTSGICFKCGSTEHQHNKCNIKKDDYKFATCFICKESGHISKQCPDNPRGLYPDGGGCNICGDVTHMKKNCPKFVKRKKDEFEITAKMLDYRAPDALDAETKPCKIKMSTKKKKVIKMN